MQNTNTINDNSYKIKKTAILGLLTAIAFVVTFICRLPIIPSVPFLDLEFKSAIILIGGFIFGPLSAFATTVVVCFIEMFTISSTGIIGCVMNILSTVCLVCPASFIYKRKKTLTGAIIGLGVGIVLMTIAMVLWNYLFTPLYMGVPRQMVVDLLLPAFIPFNLIKGALNGSVTLLLYKFVVTALRKANLIPKNENSNGKKSNIIGTILISLFVIATCVLSIFVFNGIF